LRTLCKSKFLKRLAAERLGEIKVRSESAGVPGTHPGLFGTTISAENFNGSQ
jgi:hypothetical protein